MNRTGERGRARKAVNLSKVIKLVREPKAPTKGDQHFSDILSRPIRQVLRWIGSQVRAYSLVRPLTSREQFTTWLRTPRVRDQLVSKNHHHSGNSKLVPSLTAWFNARGQRTGSTVGYSKLSRIGRQKNESPPD